MTQVLTRPMRNPQLIDRLITHYKTCPYSQIDWGTEHCVAGMLNKWGIARGEHGHGHGVRGLMDTFDLTYPNAEALFSARRPESQKRVFAEGAASPGLYTGDNFIPLASMNKDDARASIVAVLEHMKETGEVHWKKIDLS